MPKGLKQKLSQYIDAGFPILYINSFENDKIDDMIREIGDRREIVEWNGARGMVDFNTKNPLLSGNATLSSMLNLYMEKEELKRILIVLKDIHSQLETIITAASAPWLIRFAIIFNFATISGFSNWL